MPSVHSMGWQVLKQEQMAMVALQTLMAEGKLPGLPLLEPSQK